VGEVSSVLSYTEVLVVGVTSGCERGRGSQVSRGEWRKWVCVTLLVTSHGLGELCVHVSFLFHFLYLGMISACSFYSLKEVQGYRILAYCVIFLVEEPRGLGRALSGGDMVCTVEVWRWYF
jgi:hypothetical protein